MRFFAHLISTTAARVGGASRTRKTTAAAIAATSTVVAGGLFLATTSRFSTAFLDWRTEGPLRPELHADVANLPIEKAELGYAPFVPPPITRKHPVRLLVEMDTRQLVLPISLLEKYQYWCFNDHVPGPFIRARVGDVLEVKYRNMDQTGMGHNIDFHAVTGPGGGAGVLFAETGQEKTAAFRLLHPGLFIYHCAAAPTPVHIQYGMFGLILVEPEEGLPPCDKEFYVVQHELYAVENASPVAGNADVLEYSHALGLKEHPSHVLFNGKAGSLTENPLKADQGDRVRIFFGNAGPNLISSFHVIGTIFDKVYREGDLISPPARSLQTTLVPAGGAAVVEIQTSVPGNFTLVDHSIYRIEKGAVGFLKVYGSDPRTDIFASRDQPSPCPGCGLHE